MTLKAILPIVALLTGGVLATLAASGEIRRHDGRIVADDTHKALAGARAIAYAEEDAKATGLCPEHKGMIDRATADASGAFAFRVDSKLGRYYAVYCSNGYQPRGEWNQNDPRLKARPAPVRLWPLKATGVDAVDPAMRALADVLDFAARTLHAILRANETSVAVAKESTRPEDWQVLDLLVERTAADSTQPAAPEATGPAAVLDVLDNAASHCRYFWRVAPVPFAAAQQKLTSPEATAVVWLRNRPRGGH